METDPRDKSPLSDPDIERAYNEVLPMLIRIGKSWVPTLGYLSRNQIDAVYIKTGAKHLLALGEKLAARPLGLAPIYAGLWHFLRERRAAEWPIGMTKSDVRRLESFEAFYRQQRGSAIAS